MEREALRFLRCPACHGTLHEAVGRNGQLLGVELTCALCGRQWSVRDGIPDLVFPPELDAPDADSRSLWNRLAPVYDVIARATCVMRGISQRRERRDLVARLELGPDDAVLELAAGTGGNLKVLAEQMGQRATIFGLDLSRRTLQRAAQKLRHVQPAPQLIGGNAMHLPFADDAFDAVLDGFGMKYYSQQTRAVGEMLRVVKPGGKVVIAELGLGPGTRRRFRQRLLNLWIPGFAHRPPVDALPADVQDWKLEWDAHQTAYVIELRKRPA